MTLRVGIAAMPYTAAGVELVREAERLGVDSVWVPEFWAGDTTARSTNSPSPTAMAAPSGR